MSASTGKPVSSATAASTEDLTSPPRAPHAGGASTAGGAAKPATGTHSIASFFVKQASSSASSSVPSLPTVAASVSAATAAATATLPCPHCAALEKSLGAARTAHAAAQHDLDAARSELDQLRAALERANEDAANARADAQSVRDAAAAAARDREADARDIVQPLLERLVRENAVFAAQQRREQLLRDSHAIGRVVPVKEGMFVNEHWEEGVLFQNLKQRQSDLRQQKDALEKEKAEFGKLKRQKSRARNASESTSSSSQSPNWL